MGPSTRQLSEAKHAARLPPGPAPGAMSGPVEPEEPDLSPAVAARRGLRTGWTTGTCASAAAKAAYLALVSGRRPERVEVALPSGQRVGFPVEWDGDGRAVVVKDAGDDPDCTDGARMTAEVRVGGTDGAHVLHAGEGIGIITKPGLGLAVGEPAINPVPRRMILAALAEVGSEPVDITFSVPGGETMAAETTNGRLGIRGGISILGTSGIVRPFSTASYRASVVQQIEWPQPRTPAPWCWQPALDRRRRQPGSTQYSTRCASWRWATSPGSP